MEETNGIKGLIIIALKFYESFKGKWRIVFFFGFISALIGGIIGFLEKPKYSSDSLIILEDESSGKLSSYIKMASSLGFGGNSGGNGLLSPENFIELSRSKKIVYSTLLSSIELHGNNDLLVNHYFDFFGPVIIENEEGDFDTIRISNIEPFNGSLIEEDVLNSVYNKILKDCIAIETSAENSLIRIKTTFNNEVFAHVFATRYLQTIYDFYYENLINEEEEILGLLLHKQDSIESLLRIKKNQLAIMDDNYKNVVKSVADLKRQELINEVQILTQMKIQTIQSYEMSKFSAEESKKIFKVIDKPVLPIQPIKIGIEFYVFVFGLLGTGVTFGFIFLREEFLKAKSLM